MTVMPKLIDATRLEAAWAERVLANREQAERLREGGPEGDFYAPVSSLFVADPRRTGEPALDAMRRAHRTRRDLASTSARAPVDTRCHSRSG